MPARAPSKPAAPAVVLDNLCLGYNGYTSPTLTSEKMWAAATNVFAGPFGLLQRCRFANVVSGLGTGQQFLSLKYFAIPGTGSYLLGDINGKLFSYDTGSSYGSTQRLNPYVDPSGSGSATLNGPFSRETLQSIVYEMNGQVKQAGRGANAATIEGWGLDAPDTSPQVAIGSDSPSTITSITRSNGIVTATLSSSINSWAIVGNVVNVSGVTDTSFNGTFTLVSTGGGSSPTWNQAGQNVTSSGGTVNDQITKAIGRSYAWAWENANKVHVGAPGPATQYIQYSAQRGRVDLIEPGIVATNGSAIVTGTSTQFSSAWIGRHIWIAAIGDAGRIISVQSATQLTVAANIPFTVANQQFIWFDPQATHLRVYATADGGATYFRIARNTWTPSSNTVSGAGLEYIDYANAEPPNFPFTTETAQSNNLPPPIGAFVNEYQGVLIVYGVSGASQSFFYSNQTATSIGLLQESFAPLNQITLPIQNAKLNGMIEFPGSLIMWSDKQDMFRLTGLLTDNTVPGIAQATSAAQQGATIARLPYNLGSASPFATEITPLGGIWLTSNAEVWLYTDRYAPRNIGRPVQDILNSITPANLSLARMKYYHTNNRNWLALAVAANAASTNNTLLVLDLDLLASNGSPSYFTFDMATNSPSWYVFSLNCTSVETVFETGGNVRLLAGSTDLVQDADYQAGFGTEQTVTNGTVTTHAWGNDSAFLIKRPSFFRFLTNRPPSVLGPTPVAITAVSSFTLQDPSAVNWKVTMTDGGVLQTSTSGAGTPQTVILNDSTLAGTAWNVGITTGGVLIQTPVAYNSGYPSAFNMLTTPSGLFSQLTIRSGALQASNPTSQTTFGGDGWSFQVLGIDDDFYTFASPLILTLTPGVNDTSSLCGNPDLVGGSPFRHSPGLFRVGGVNFVMGRRLKFKVNFPTGTGINYQFRGIQMAFGANPPE